MTPTFDPETQTWFTDDGREAKSLALLSLGQGCPILEGYYPTGVPLELIAQNMKDQMVFFGIEKVKPQILMRAMPKTQVDEGITGEWKGSGLKASPRSSQPGANRIRNKGRARIYDYEAIMAARDAGLSYAQIVEKFNMKSTGAVGAIVSTYNKQRRQAAMDQAS